MSPATAVPLLVTWTPYLLGGFVWNIIVSLGAMLLGTVLGALLAGARANGQGWTARAAVLTTHVMRNIPTFVFLYYVAFLLPFEIQVAGSIFPFPAWIKASLALAVAVTGFVSDNLGEAILAWRQGRHSAAQLFVPAWTMYFVIIVMASSTASVIGVPELVARANTVIGAVGDDGFMVYAYGYAMLVFFVFCMPVTLIMRHLRRHLASRMARVATI